jgi:hypothetical protein
MTTLNNGQSLSRRTAMTGLGGAGLGLALAATARSVVAKDAAVDMANHPLVGTWLAGTSPTDIALNYWGADGSMTLQTTIYPGQSDGSVVYNDQAMGVWEPIDARGIHITFTWATRDASGASRGSTTVDGFPVASEDGMSFVDEGTKVVITLRDPTGAVTQVINTVPRVIGVRVRPGNPGYEDLLALLAASPVATPTS